LACGRPRSISEELLRAFVAVQDVGSISRAAPKLGYSQPGLSQLVQSLERIVGHLLFVRGAKGVS
jgi:DNA-binding transcriptional LysR family regulator